MENNFNPNEPKPVDIPPQSMGGNGYDGGRYYGNNANYQGYAYQNVEGQPVYPVKGYGCPPPPQMQPYGHPPYGYPVDPNGVTPYERKLLKDEYFGVFSRGIIHTVGTEIVVTIIYIAVVLMGFEFKTTAEDKMIFDWFYCLIAFLPSMIMCAALFIQDKAVSHYKLGELFKADNISGKFILGFFGMLMLAFSLATFLENFVIAGFGAVDISPFSEENDLETEYSTPLLIVEFFTIAVIGPVFEELLYRGVILRRLCAVSTRFAIVLSSLMFGCMHGNILQAILGFFVGLVLGYAAVKTGSLILPVAGHIFINFFSVSVDYVTCLLGEDIANDYYTAGVIMFSLIGLITLIVLLAKRAIHPPEYTDYHRKRTLPIAVSCVSFWVLGVLYLYDIVSAFGSLS